MSLTSFYRDNADVRARFRQEFQKPVFPKDKALRASPLTARYMTVGTAFDYLLRFQVQRLNPNAQGTDRWIADDAVSRLVASTKLYNKGIKIITKARSDLEKYQITGKMSDELIESALMLATLDPIFRAGVGHENIGLVDKDDIKDLKNIASLVDAKCFTAKHLCLLNPTFGSASTLVGGADADLVIDANIIDIKTTKNFDLPRTILDQVLGYYVLHCIGSVGEIRPKHEITGVGIYYSRHGYLHVVSLEEFINPKTFPKFLKWFEKRAKQAFG